ncbi:imidazolonepropionase [Clostridium sp. DMHC 10]|uniref:imidazolonepropionase n=1 Tax=Clostridium sp. DMHC 10 TaxID=747377 RepID=UPI00069E8538|nr:imidazolonepropionase [Clostridium sp. DMHC 10]KOF56484.1 imidazolonepropionase [Clostridium sp. DMHC 10]
MDKIIIFNASEIATPTGSKAKYGKEMNDISIIKNGSIVIENGLIRDVGPTTSITRKYNLSKYNIIDAKDKSIVPGFVDAHTHFIFGGYREEEFFQRINGTSYMEIMNNDGGIESTVKKTRNMTLKELYEVGLDRLNSMLGFGITTVEGKSGYGLDFQTETKQLKVMKKLDESHPVDVVSTFLGAHATPQEYKGKNDEYIDFMIEKLYPYIVRNKLAEFCDVFCEDGVFSIEESRKLLLEAKKLGFKLKVHADEISSFGGAELASSIGAISADHLLNVSDEGIKEMAKNKVVSVLLPATAFTLDKPFANARKMIDDGCAVALGSDYNPGSCFSNSIPLIISLACIKMRMTPEEILTALTINGAAALDREASIGSIEIGKKADLLMLKYPSYKYLMYNTGINIVDTVVKNGEIKLINKY